MINQNTKNEILGEINQAIDNKLFPGCVIGIVQKNGDRDIIHGGNFTYDHDSLNIQEDSIFDLASITKSIPTAILALMLIDQGRLKLTDKLIDYIPEFNNSHREDVSIKHLLTSTIDGCGAASLKTKSYQEFFDTVMTKDFEWAPGTKYKYSNITFFFLGLVVEKIFSKNLDILANTYFFEPLAMNRTTFHPDTFPKNEIVPTEIDNWRGLVHGVIHDESAFISKEKSGKVLGSAGLFSTAPDLLNFLEMLLHEGNFNGKKYFSKEIVKEMHTNQFQELGVYVGLGWELYQTRYMGERSTNNTFGKPGFTGTICICDIEKGVAYTILSNRTYPKRPENSITINKFRATIGDLISRSTLDNFR